MRRSSYRAEEITAVAVEIAERYGVCGVTTAALARRLKFTEAALYRHFPGKNAILAAALTHMGERLLATMLLELTPEAARDATGVAEQLERHARRFAVSGGLLLEFLLHAVTSRGREIREAGSVFMREYLGRTEVYFRGLESRGLVANGPPDDLARLWMCQMMGGFVRSRLTDEAWDPLTQPGLHAFIAAVTSGAVVRA